MTIRILVNGAQGKMGQEVVAAVNKDPELKLVGQAGKTDDLSQLIKETKAEVVVDFTTPRAVYENALAILAAGVHPVIGTTGLAAEQISELKERCAAQKTGGIIAPNFSIGAVLMMQFAQTAARYYSAVEIIEFHHQGKQDAPSGTAIKTAEMINAACENQFTPKPLHETIAGSRGALKNGIPIHAVRLPGFVASQEVLFGGLGETLTIRHNTIHREAFMAGVLLACKKVVKLDKLIYGLENILV